MFTMLLAPERIRFPSNVQIMRERNRKAIQELTHYEVALKVIDRPQLTRWSLDLVHFKTVSIGTVTCTGCFGDAHEEFNPSRSSKPESSKLPADTDPLAIVLAADAKATRVNLWSKAQDMGGAGAESDAKRRRAMKSRDVGDLDDADDDEVGDKDCGD